MAKKMSITDKLSQEKPVIEINGKDYPVETSVEMVFLFDEKLSSGENNAALEAVKSAIGEEAFEELDVRRMQFDNFRVLLTAVAATIQGISYDDAAARFQREVLRQG